MKKIFKTMLAVALAIVLLVPAQAFAAELKMEMPVKKTLTLTEDKEKVVLPEMKFTFSLVADETAVGPYAEDGKTPLYVGNAELLKLASNAIDFNNETPFENMKATKETKLVVDETTLAKDEIIPGIYRYVLTEDAAPEIDGLTGDQTRYVIDVYVFLQDGKKVASIVSYKLAEGEKIEDTKKSEPSFGDDTEDTTDDGTNTYTTNPVKVTKKIAGTGADMAKEFEFTIIVTGAEGETYLTSDPNVKLTTGVATTVKLGHEKSIEVYGLSPADKYEISEKAENYTQSNSGDPLTGAIGTEAKDITVTNTLDANVPTGVIETIAPFAVMIIAALGFALVYFRKRQDA